MQEKVTGARNQKEVQENHIAVGELNKQIKKYKEQLNGIPPYQYRKNVREDIELVLNKGKTTEEIANASVWALCNVISHFLYGQAVGVIPPDKLFNEFYLEEIKKRIHLKD